VPDNQPYIQQMVPGQEILVVMEWGNVMTAMAVGAMLTLVIIGVWTKLTGK
jgi:hypothetical protein